MPTPTATIFLPYSALDAVILRGARAAQPAASAVVPGTLYCVTDEGAPVERSNGTTWQVYSPTPGGSGTGTGDVVGPGVATDQAIALYDGTTGKLIQDSATTIPALTASIESSVTASVIPVDLATETTGTLPDARLSANVQMKPIAATDLPAHATRHQPGGADALAVDAAAATGSLRTLGTGAQQAAPGNDARFGAPTAPLAHHATHEPGGADALAALSAAILTSGTLPDARLSANVQMKPVALADLPASVATKPIAESDVTNLVSDLALKAPLASPALTGVPIAPTATAGTSTTQLATTAFVGAAVTSGTATPAAHHATHETGGSDAIVALSGAVITSGTVADARLSANVALLSASNVFTAFPPGNVFTQGMRLQQPAAPVDHRLWQVYDNTAGDLYFQSLNDAGTVNQVAYPLVLTRGGNLTIFADFTEKNRTTPLGHWIDFTPAVTINAGTLTVTTNYTTRYTLVGKTITIAFFWAVTVSVGTATDIQLTIPASLTSSGYMVASPVLSAGPGVLQVVLGGAVVYLRRDLNAAGTFPAGAQTFAGTITFSIP